jgi:RHS repeat-associated protein
MAASRVALVVVLLLLIAAPASAATPAKVSVSGPSSLSAGASAKFTLTVKAGSRKLAKGALTLLLSTDAKADKKDRTLATKSVKNVKARKSSKLALTVKLPATTAARSYRVLACLKVGKKTSCAARTLKVTKAPIATVPAPSPVTPTPATPFPAPAPVTPAPTATPDPGSPPVVVIDQAPAPGPVDAPAANPAAVASPLAAADASSLQDATKFLYTGANAIQPGVAANTITVERAAVLRGRVTNRLGGAIGGARVTVLDHPEFGRTSTRIDGGYDLAVNGGGALTLVFEREGYIPAQRLVDVPWQAYSEVDPLVLVPFDPRGTRIDTAGGDIDAVQGSTVTDSSGTRTQTLLFEPGTTATMEVDGVLKPLGDDFVVRSTEFTQGATGPAAMPGQLPPNTAYTYAAEFSIDEASAAGATDVRFSKPVATYLDNFLDLPVGAPVPAGWYDRESGNWIGAPNGRVVRVVAGGVDTDGDGTADNTGVDAAEQIKLATLYPVGKSLWRVEVTHFTPWDYNYPYGPSEGANGPDGELLGGPNAQLGPGEGIPEDPCPGAGSVILCDDQILSEYLPVSGTDSMLVYRSDRVPGRSADRTLDIRLRNGAIDPSLAQIELTVSVAGRVFTRSFTPAESLANPVYAYDWDGLDAYGRRIQGTQTATIKLGYTFVAVLQRPSEFASSWARLSGSALEASKARTVYTLSQSTTARLKAFDARGEGLGGWTLSDHHAYDPESKTLRLGDGGSTETGVNRVGSLVPVTGPFDGPSAVVTEPDGSVLVADTRNQRIKRIALDGTVTVVAGSGVYGYRPTDDGGAATAARLSSPQGLAVDGKVIYIADTSANRVRRIDAAGRITTVAGGGTALGDDGPATAARLSDPTGVAIAPDGALYIADTDQDRVRMVGTDGTITTVAGDGTPGFSGDGGLASAARLRGPVALTLDSQGGLLVADAGNSRVRRIGTDGRIHTVAGGGNPVTATGDGGPATDALLSDPTGLAFTGDGDLLIADAGSGLLRAVDEAGQIRSIGGGGTQTRVGRAAVGSVTLDNPTGIAVRPDHSLVLTEPAKDLVSTVAEPLPGFRNGDYLIASPDATELFQFDATGRHMRTLDALTSAVLRRFTYDASGRLTAIYDDAADAAQPHAALVTFERPNASTVLLRTRGGRTTTLALDAAGWLDSVTNPAGEEHQLTHGASGLLTAEADAEGAAHAFLYDARGRLVRDTSPGNYVQTLSLVETPTSRTVTRTTGGGQVTTYRTENVAGTVIRTVTEPSGGKTITRRTPDGKLNATFPDGSTLDQTLAPDPRFGLQAPYAALTKTTSPGNRTSTTVGTRAVTMRNDIRVEKVVETIVVDGKTTTRTFQAGAGDSGGTRTDRSPTGRDSVTVFDNHGRATSIRLATTQLPIVTTYDDAHDGRVATQTRGTRSSTYDYDARNRVIGRMATGAATVTYGYDLADRVLTETRDGRTWKFTYNRVGERTSMETPTTRKTSFTQTLAGLAETMTLPGTLPYGRTYTADRLPATQTLPSGEKSTQTYDAGGSRLAGRVDTAAGGGTLAATAFTYNAGTGNTATESWTAGAVTQGLATSYDGELTTELAFTGAAEGTISLTPANIGFKVASMEVAAGAGAARTYAIARNNDGLPTSFGPYAITRDAATGSARSFADATDGTAVQTLDTKNYGELDERRVLDGANTRYSLVLTRDGGGRVVRREETIAGGAPIVRAYEYDTAGHLTLVRNGDGGPAIEAYGYDAEGDRTSATSSDHPLQAATYDTTRDLQTAAGPLAMSFDVDGFLQSRGGRAFNYGPSGELLSAEAAGGTVAYAYDATGRLVRRSLGAARTTFLYGNPDNFFQITASVDQAGELTTYFYDENDMLHAFDRGGTRYRVGVDQVGSPRVIVAGDGTIVGQIDRDSFGRILASSGSVTLPLGFAGGIEDPDTGLVRFGLRDYDPQTGRFTARDPSFYVGSPDNLYAYAGSAPTNRRDPTGLWSIGLSGYLGIGGGATFSFANGSFGLCIEVGAGLGAGGELDLGGSPSDGNTVFAELSATAPNSLGIGIGVERPDCPPNGSGPLKVTGKGIAGPASVAIDNQSGLSGAQVGGGAELKAQGKIGQKTCKKFSTSWW